MAERQKAISLDILFLKSYFFDYAPTAPDNSATEQSNTVSADTVSVKPVQLIENNNYQSLEFTEKEIAKMPKQFRSEFRINGCTARIRLRRDGRYRRSYEIRYRRNGYNITASATTKEEAKQKFIEKLHIADKHAGQANVQKYPRLFNDFIVYWLENYYKRRVCEDQFKNYERIYRNKLAPRFNRIKTTQISVQLLQETIDAYADKGRTAEDVHCLLNQVFNYGVDLGLVARNPMNLVYRKKHTRKHGKALTYEEEKLLLSATERTPYQLMFAVALFTGLRPNEYKTVKIDGKMIVARNSKRKNGEIEFKRIPILKMLKPFLDGVTAVKWYSVGVIRNKFNEILPNHQLKDLRTTFYTRCEMFKVAESAKNEFVGHSSSKLNEAYTDLPDEFLLQEAEKLVW